MPAAPESESDVVDAVADAVRTEERLAIIGGGSKSGIGRGTDARPLPMTGLTGVVDYDPAELVLTLRPGTPLADVESLVAGERQMLPFEPFDYGPIFGRHEGTATIGGVFAAGVAGSRRISAGAARDHLLGFRAVSGRAELFVAGAKVVKNVTGFDLPKLAAGSWGRLFAMTELTLKVLPKSETNSTRFVAGLHPAEAARAMAAAMGSQAEVAAAAHQPGARGGLGITAIRVEGFAPSVAARGAMLDRVLADFGPVEQAEDDEAASFWSALRTLAPLADRGSLWRVNVAPSEGPAIVETLTGLDVQWMMDWAGGLIWIAGEGITDLVRGAAMRAAGHATLVRADAALRGAVPAFQPAHPSLARLEERVRRAFDPAGVFETGRF